ncbi:MAG: gamma carbonic anhydrase family protein [Thermoplasmatota archaeon]
MNVGKDSYVAPTAVMIGDVSIGERCSIWEHAVIRADLNSITIGNGSNVQDCCVLHVPPDDCIVIGEEVSIGHGAIVHGARVDDDCIVGINATLLDGVHVEPGCIVAANAVVPPGMHIPANSLAAGVPARVIRQDEKLLDAIRENAEHYHYLRKQYLDGAYRRD